MDRCCRVELCNTPTLNGCYSAVLLLCLSLAAPMSLLLVLHTARSVDAGPDSHSLTAPYTNTARLPISVSTSVYTVQRSTTLLLLLLTHTPIHPPNQHTDITHI